MGIIDKKAFINDGVIPVLHSNMLLDYITQAQKAQSIEEIHTVCSHITHDHGYDYFIYAARFLQAQKEPHVLIISGYPDDWRDHYIQNNYQPQDPTVLHCATKITPIFWENLSSSYEDDSIGKVIMKEAKDFGLINGISIPIHGVHGDSAMLSLCSSQNSYKANKDNLYTLPTVDLLSKYVHEATCRIMTSEEGPLNSVQLTPREKEVLQWVAQGKESWAISNILNIAERTVLFHIQNICRKLGVYKRQHAVAKAISLNIISL